MGPNVLDTNVIIELVNGSLPPSSAHKISTWLNQGLCATSIISQIEVFSFSTMSKQEEQEMNELFDAFNVIPLSEEIARATWQLRRKIKIKLPDAIIAATALHYGLALVTRNAADFQRVPGLQCLDPHAF